jgi:YVTN family beta-propeller protein
VRSPRQGRGPDGTIWIPNFQDNTISVIDPTTNAVVATVKTGAWTVRRPERLRDMWVGSYKAKQLRRAA